MLPNPTTTYAQTFVTALAACGLTDVVISPGSRSTPLTLAFAAQGDVRVHPALDERSAGFFALGLALATDRPVALVCTSGTAVANYLPAIIEATMSQVPLLVLTSDRPHELRHSGANQTIDQIKIYGDQVLWSVDAALPQDGAPDVALRNLETLAARAHATADGLRKGPVHVNFPFRKPLEPAAGAHDRHTPVATPLIGRGILLPAPGQVARLVAIAAQHPRGLIVCGPRSPTEPAFATAVTRLSVQLGYPIMADAISGIRFQANAAGARIISGYETFLQGDPGWEEPQVILRFGAVPVSKWLNAYLDRIAPAHRIHVRASGVWADDSHRTTWLLQADETAVCQALGDAAPTRTDSAWETAVAATDAATWQILDAQLPTADFDGAYVADVVAQMPAHATLFMGNSLPIRHLDQYGRGQGKPLFAYASRGASGIDGNVSTALGLHVGRGGKLVAVLGDITFYHDMNGLLQIRQGNLRDVTLVVLNNDGGGIFSRLPVAQHDPPFTALFRTPHGLGFEPAARLYGLDYTLSHGRDDFRAHLDMAIAGSRPTLIEVRTDNGRDETVRKQLNRSVLEGLRPQA